MGIADTVRLLSQIYGGHSGPSKPRRSRSRFFQKWSDTQPLGQHTSASSSYPEEQDLKVAGGLLNPSSIQIPSNPTPVNSETHAPQTLQTLVPDVPPSHGFENCTQIVSDLGVQSDLRRYYSLPKVRPENDSGQGVSVTQSDPLPRGSTRSSKRSRKFLSISRVFNTKRSRNLRIPSTISGDTKPSGGSSLPQSSVQDVGIGPDGHQSPRKVSDQTTISEQSTNTVCHYPPKHREDNILPLETEDRQGDYNPFTEQVRYRNQSGDSNPFRSEGKSSDETDVFLSSESAPFEGGESYVERPVRKSPRPSSLRPPPRNQSRSWDSLSYRIFSDTNVAMRNFDQSKAAYNFNFFAMKLNLVPLRLDRSGRPITGSSFSLVPVKARTPAGSLLRSIRSFKSTMTLKPKAGTRTLRRIKTLANISTHYQLSSLKGKPLDALARLGGHSFLNLPPGFAPITLKLPVCIAATAHYVALHGRKMPHIFLDCGDDRVVRKLYDHFAGQVLSAESSKEKIDSTTRGSFLPSDSLSSASSYAPNTSTYIHNVATALKRFLAGLPGGVLGSVELYGTLKRIHDQEFNDEELRMDPAFGDFTVNGKSASSAVRVKMVALALLALTTDMQLELICAVFGLTALIAYETEKQVVQSHGRVHGNGRTCSGCHGFSDSKALGEIFGPLLLSGPEGTDPSEVIYLAKKNVDIGAAGVATMLIDIWRDVCLQFQIWKVFCPVSGS